MVLTAITGTYIDSRTLGQYPNATFEYMGERNFPEQESFWIRFGLKTENGTVIKESFWIFEGATPSGNTILNHGELSWSGATGTTDFVTYLQGGGDLDDPSLTVIDYPSVGYEDINTYFILGGKKDVIQLPANPNARALMKWLLLKRVSIGVEAVGNQFNF